MNPYKSDIESYIEKYNITDRKVISLLKEGWNVAIKSILKHSEKRHIFINDNTKKRFKQWIEQ